MESFDPGEIIPHCFHANGFGAEYRGYKCPRVKENDEAILALDKTKFHVFGMLWEPDGYTMFVDGRQHGPKVGWGEGESVSQTEEFVLLTTEAKWYRRNDKPVPELEAAASSGELALPPPIPSTVPVQQAVAVEATVAVPQPAPAAPVDAESAYRRARLGFVAVIVLVLMLVWMIQRRNAAR